MDYQEPMLFTDGLPATDIGYRGASAAAAAGISYRQLDYWDRTQLVVPSIQTATGSGGRLMVELDLSQANPHARYELVIASGAYWQKHQTRSTPQIMEEIIIRFNMKDPDGRYHIPIILSPNSYSVWWSR